MQTVMTNAWTIARKGKNNFGGNVKQYIGQALSMAWALFKKEDNAVEEVNKEYTHTFKSGDNEIEVNSVHMTKEEVSTKDLFGNYTKEMVDCNKVEITGVKFNGVETFDSYNSSASFIDHHVHGVVLRLYNVNVRGKNHKVALIGSNEESKNIVAAPFKKLNDEMKAKVKPAKVSAYEASLCKHCHSDCYGDCQAN